MQVLRSLILIALVVLSTLALSVQGVSSKFGDCPEDRDCDAAPKGDPHPPELVTGHSIYAGWRVAAPGSGSSSDVPKSSPHLPGPEVPEARLPQSAPTPHAGWDLAQGECLAWTNGKNVDVRPKPDPVFSDGQFFSDEDEASSDAAAQDYDHGRSLTSCVPFSNREAVPTPVGSPTDFALAIGYIEFVDENAGTKESVRSPAFAVVVEKGDCDPAKGTRFRYRGHLDFVDPNHIYHEVQEYDYVCSDALWGGGPAGHPAPAGPGASAFVSDTVKTLFPWTYTGANATDACAWYETPIDGKGRFDLGHKCNGSMQDLFTERLWITPVHGAVFDTEVLAYYNFALAVDTCSGVNVHEHAFFGGLEPHDLDAFDHLLDGAGSGMPRAEVCHDGSSFSFDDTPRGRTRHTYPPAWLGHQDYARGLSYDENSNSSTFGTHRQNCRVNHIDWPYNDHPGPNRAPAGPAGVFEETGVYARDPPHRTDVNEECFPEDHKTASVDIYVYDHDPTGLFGRYANGSTGGARYVEGMRTGPDHAPSP